MSPKPIGPSPGVTGPTLPEHLPSRSVGVAAAAQARLALLALNRAVDALSGFRGSAKFAKHKATLEELQAMGDRLTEIARELERENATRQEGVMTTAKGRKAEREDNPA